MKVTLMGLFQMKSILSRELIGVNVETGERKKPDLRLPVSMKRHLRRVLEAVDTELKIADPERLEFITKWKVYGENKDELPKFGEVPDFDKEYSELFFTPDFTIAFSPFHLELLDDFNEVVPDDIEALMTDMNKEFKNQQKEDNPAKGDSDKAPESANANA
jgi:hypothetical protein